MAQNHEAQFERSWTRPRTSLESLDRSNAGGEMVGPNDVRYLECEIDLRVGGKIYSRHARGEAMGPYKEPDGNEGTIYEG